MKKVERMAGKTMSRVCIICGDLVAQDWERYHLIQVHDPSEFKDYIFIEEDKENG